MSEQENRGRGKKRGTSRRTFMVGGAAAAVGAAAGSTLRSGKISDEQARLIDKVTEASATGAASLSDVKHIVILMQENRSFDHYFGTISGVRGFSDPNVLLNANGTPIFEQYGYQPGTGPSSSGYLQPFNLLNDPPSENGEDTNDIAHDWVTQHDSWDGGKLDSFITAHLAADGHTNGPVTMGYFTRSELSFYYALADAFTICDGYFCSVLGPTDPNRLMAISASIDPAGGSGGPVITTASDRIAMTGTLNWKTYPEALLEAGVSWKVYNDPTGILGLGVLSYFQNYTDIFSLTGLELIARGITPSYPGSFQDDVENGTLPSVSWVIPTLFDSDHPASGCNGGPRWVTKVVNAVGTSQYWKHTAVILMWDDWGGWYDPVPPPQENYTSLGMRIPLVLISPYAKPSYISETEYNYGSILRFIEETFGLGSLGTTDATANSLSDSFDYSQTPNVFKSAPLPPAASCADQSTPNGMMERIIEHDGGVPE